MTVSGQRLRLGSADQLTRDWRARRLPAGGLATTTSGLHHTVPRYHLLLWQFIWLVRYAFRCL